MAQPDASFVKLSNKDPEMRQQFISLIASDKFRTIGWNRINEIQMAFRAAFPSSKLDSGNSTNANLFLLTPSSPNDPNIRFCVVFDWKTSFNIPGGKCEEKTDGEPGMIDYNRNCAIREFNEEAKHAYEAENGRSDWHLDDNKLDIFHEAVIGRYSKYYFGYYPYDPELAQNLKANRAFYKQKINNPNIRQPETWGVEFARLTTLFDQYLHLQDEHQFCQHVQVNGKDLYQPLSTVPIPFREDFLKSFFNHEIFFKDDGKLQSVPAMIVFIMLLDCLL